MVLLQNINIGQRVEVLYHGGLYRGTVKFKGFLNGIAGEWVGVELNNPVGKHDGMIRGRRYFSCQPNHGIFTDASNIRFIRSVRYLHDPYHCVNKDLRESEIEEDLFESRNYGVERSWQDPSFITSENELFYRSLTDDSCRLPRTYRSFHLPHTVSNRIPAATMLRPHSAKSLYTRYTGRPIHYEYEDVLDDFITRPSIPKIHMPHEALRHQVSRGWDGSHYVREMSVNTGRDSVKFNQWNDI